MIPEEEEEEEGGGGGDLRRGNGTGRAVMKRQQWKIEHLGEIGDFFSWAQLTNWPRLSNKKSGRKIPRCSILISFQLLRIDCGGGYRHPTATGRHDVDCRQITSPSFSSFSSTSAISASLVDYYPMIIWFWGKEGGWGKEEIYSQFCQWISIRFLSIISATPCRFAPESEAASAIINLEGKDELRPASTIPEIQP